MKQQAGIAFLFLIYCVASVASTPIGKKTKVSFDKSLPEDISNKNFPDIIESFDYPNANILDLVKAIGKLTGLNFIVDPALSEKKITVIAPSKITTAEAYKAFLSALSINGYALVKSGAFWKIQETKKALKDNTEIYSGDYFPNTDQLITRIIKLKHINAKEFSSSIKYLLSQNNQISYHASSNSMIISDYGSVIERIMKIVYTMDTPGSEESVIVIPVQYAAAADIEKMLLALNLSSQKISSRNKRSFKEQRIKSGNIKISSIISDSRTNSIVVLANAEGVSRVKTLVSKLDTYIDPSRTGGIYVYNVLYGTAEQVYNTLMGIGGSNTSKRSLTRGSTFNFGRSSSSRSGGFNSSRGKTSPLFDNVTILADINTNSLIISAKNKYDFARVKEVLKKIDVPRDQVFVQAVIVEMLVDQGDHWEVNLASTLSKGLTGWLKFLKIGGAPIVGFLNRSFSANPSMLQRSKLGPGLVLGLPFKDFLKGNNLGSFNNLQGENLTNFIESEAYKNLGSEDLKRSALQTFNQSSGANQALNQALNLSVVPLFQLLKKAGNVNVLSTPQITAMDNTTASIEVGENAPVGIVSTSGAVSAISQNSVDRQDVTLKLEITPRINPDSGTIQMDISQKFDDFSERQSTASELQDKGVHIVKRNIETKMVLNDGETAVLGGLFTDKETRIVSKVPILGDIPVIGWLFKGVDIKKEKRNLIVFITPTIIRGKDQKNQTRQLLNKKLDERIHFIRKNMKGRDPHGDYLKKLTAKGKKDLEENLELEEFELVVPKSTSPAEEPIESQPSLPDTEAFSLDVVPQEEGSIEPSFNESKEEEIDFINIENTDEIKPSSKDDEEELFDEEEEPSAEDKELSEKEEEPSAEDKELSEKEDGVSTKVEDINILELQELDEEEEGLE